MVWLNDVRRLVLDFPEVTEKPHHRISSFRVRDKIFATIPDDQHLHIMLTTEYMDIAIDTMPEACEKLSWGRRFVGVRVNLSRAKLDVLGEILRIACQCKTPPQAVKKGGNRKK